MEAYVLQSPRVRITAVRLFETSGTAIETCLNYTIGRRTVYMPSGNLLKIFALLVSWRRMVENILTGSEATSARAVRKRIQYLHYLVCHPHPVAAEVVSGGQRTCSHHLVYGGLGSRL